MTAMIVTIISVIMGTCLSSVFIHSFPVDTTKNVVQTWSILVLYLYSKQECRPQTLQQFGLGLKVNLQRQFFWFEHGFLDIGFQRLD